MITAKPTFNSIFSMTAFLVLMFAAFGYTAYVYFNEQNAGMFIYFSMIFSGGLAFGLLIKFLWNWKIVEIAKEKFIVKYPFRFQSLQYNGKQLMKWSETTIKTWGGQYSELAIKFEDNKKVSISRQEHTDYEKSRNYLMKKFKSKKSTS